MIHDTFRPRFLGKVRLGTPETMPGVDPVQDVDPSGSNLFKTAVPDVLPPVAGCVLVGYKAEVENSEHATRDVERRTALAREYGYTDIREVELPPCDVAPGFENSWEQVLDPSCIAGYGSPSKAIWACPGPDHERIVQDNKARATEGCEFLFLNNTRYNALSDENNRVNAAISAGRRVVRVYTGKTLNAGTKSELQETEVWSCPRFNAVSAPPVSGGNERVAPLPLAPKADLVPVVAGAGVVAIIAAVIGGAFGK